MRSPLTLKITGWFQVGWSAGYWADEVEADSVSGHYEGRIAEAKSALPDDINIWEHQIYLEPPGLATSEAAGFRRLRRWATQFYPAA